MNRIHLLFSMFFLLVQSCNDYNPFENKDNIDVKVQISRSSIGSLDSMSIFSTESLTLYPTVSEMIDSFVVTSEGNRLWPNKSKTIVRPKAGEYPFYFSWNDTGRASVMFTVYRSDGESFSKNYLFHLYSPLFQDSIISEVGVPCKLFTPRPGDPGLSYIWSFGKLYGQPVVHESNKASPDSVKLQIGQTSGIGDLWVKDTNGVRSPVVHFRYRFTDTHGPLIARVSAGSIVNGDTIVTGDSIFALRMLVSDMGGVRNVTINRGEYDDREITAGGDLITRILFGVQTATKAHPRADTVVATDVAGSSSTRIFYTYYSPGGPQTHAVVLRIVSPSISTWNTIDTTISVVYRLFNYSPDTVYVRASRGTTIANAPDRVMPGSDTTLTWECPLASGSNPIRVVAYRSDTIASERVVVERGSGIVDRSPMFVTDLRVNDKEGVRHFTQEDHVILSFLALGNGIKKVTVNDKNISKSPSQQSRYFDTLSVSQNGTTIKIDVADSNGLHKDTNVYVKRNTLPVLTGSISRQYTIGISRSDTLSVSDSDGDTVSLSLSYPSDPAIAAAFTIKKIHTGKVVVNWSGLGNPPEGQYTMGITLWDGIQSELLQRQFFVTTAGNVDVPSYSIERKIGLLTDTLADGTIDMTTTTIPVRVEVKLLDKLKEFSAGDSLLIENADAVTFSNEPGKFTLLIDPRRDHLRDTINVIVRGIDGVIDTAGRIAVIYPPRSPDLISTLTYWLALDSTLKDVTLRGTNTIEWWYNRVNSIKQFYSYTTGKEALIDNQLTPGKKPALAFGPRKVVLINYPNESLGENGDWPSSGYTAFFVAKFQGTVPVGGGALWSSSDYDSTYFALGVSKSGKIAVLNRPINADSGSVYESNISLDTSWHVIMYRSSGVLNDASKCTIKMGISGIPSDSVLALTSGQSSNIMLGSANKHIGNITWPGKIAESLFYKRVLTDDECHQVWAYLFQRHLIKK